MPPRPSSPSSSYPGTRGPGTGGSVGGPAGPELLGGPQGVGVVVPGPEGAPHAAAARPARQPVPGHARAGDGRLGGGRPPGGRRRKGRGGGVLGRKFLGGRRGGQGL